MVWTTVPIATLYTGLYDGPHATPKPSMEGPVFLGIPNMREDGGLDLSDIRHIAEEDYPTWTRRVVPQEGDIVFSYEATLHRYAVIPQGFRGCLGRRMALIRPKRSKVNTRYLYYYFFTQRWRETVGRYLLIGSTVDRIPLTDFPKFEVTLPLLSTQRRIAAVLSAYDDLIENNARRIAILEEMARNLYREWFVEFRFPGHESVGMVDGVLEGWEEDMLDKHISVDKGISYKGSGLTPDGLPMVNLKCISPDGGFNRAGTKPYSGEYKSRHVVLPGDIVIANTDLTQEGNVVGSPAIVPPIKSNGDILISHHIFAVRRFSSTPLSRYFLYHLMLDREFKSFAKGFAIGTTVLGLPKEGVLTYRFVRPSANIIRDFDHTVTPMYKLMNNLEERNYILRRTRDLLLPKLVSGEVDVSELEITGVA